MGLLIRNIKGLVQVEDDPRPKVSGKDMSAFNYISDAFLYLEKGRITDFGSMSHLPGRQKDSKYVVSQEIDATGRFVFP